MGVFAQLSCYKITIEFTRCRFNSIVVLLHDSTIMSVRNYYADFASFVSQCDNWAVAAGRGHCQGRRQAWLSTAEAPPCTQHPTICGNIRC